MNSFVKSGDILAIIQDELLQVENLMRSQADERHPELEAALRHLLSSGGKRVRPAVALLMGEMLEADQDRLVTLAASIELLHTATLVHDDLIDGAILRRGIATLNSQWSPAATVLTGDFIFAQAAKLAAETHSVPVIRMFAETLSAIVTGEITQLFATRRIPSREDYEKRIYAKTASLFVLAAVAAALLSPEPDSKVGHARNFGHCIGMAFQIVDDVLDLTGEQATVGKPVASDLRQGLITLPSLYFLEHSPDDEDIMALMDGKFASETMISRLVEKIRASGAIEQSVADAQGYVERGLNALDGFPQSRQRQALTDLARYFVQRDL